MFRNFKGAIRRNPVYINWRLPILCSFIIVSTIHFSGCTVFTRTIPGGKETSKLFYESYANTWNATISALETIPLDVVDRYNGIIKTGWIENKSGRETPGLIFVKRWKERYRLLISVISMSALDNKAEVSIIIHAEERAPAGVQAFNWQRKSSDGTREKNLLEKIEQLLMH